MGINYTLCNINAATATAVLVKNLLAGTPTSPCGTSTPTPTPEPAPEPTPVPSFVYTPWQLLNPSFGATEAFAYNDTLSVVIKKSSAGSTIQSRPSTVYPGNSYMLVVGEDDIQIVLYRQNGKHHVEIITPTPSVDPFTVDIDWRLNNLPVGTSQNIGPDTSACFQPDNGTLIFIPVAAGKAGQTFAPGDIPAQSTSYQPPGYVTQVGIELNLDEASGTPVYTFDQPNAAGQD